MKATIYDVAQKADVSICTASKVLNGQNKFVRKDAIARAKRVMEAARTLGYAPNHAAKSIATGRTGNIGFILADDVTHRFANYFFGQILCGVQDYCAERSYSLVVGTSALSCIKKFLMPQMAAGRQIEGVILAGYKFEPENIRSFLSYNIPCVCIGSKVFTEDNVACLTFSHNDYIEILAEYISGLGHTHMGMACVFSDGQLDSLKMICDRILKKYGISISIIPIKDRENYDAGKDIYEEYIKYPENERPEVIVGSDQTCVGAINYFRQKGINCPEQISFISNTDSPLCEYSYPAITAVRKNIEHAGSRAAELLLNSLSHKKPLQNSSLDDLNVELIIRNSVADKK